MKILVQLVLLMIALFPTQVAGAISSQEKLDRNFEDQLSESDRLHHQTYKSQFRVAQQVTQIRFKKALVANDEVATISFPGWGSIEAAIRDYAIQRSEGISVGVYQKTPAGFVDVKDPAGGNIPLDALANVSTLNTYLQSLIQQVGQGALTNQAVDKDKPFNVFAYTGGYTSALSWVNYLYISKTFSLIKAADGSYHLPDFSSFELGLVASMVYPIPHATRVIGTFVYNEAKTNRTGFYSKVLDSDFGTIDPKYDYSLEADHQYVSIPTGTATRGTNETTMFNLMVIVDYKKHYAIGPMGKQSPFIDDVRVSDSGVEIDITAATNSVLKVEAAQSLTSSWAPFGDLYTPTPSVTFKAASCGPIGFYRVRTTE